jgi:GNAT superfamily N-acetyltransferase
MNNVQSVQVMPLRTSIGTYVESLIDVDRILMRAYKMPSRLSRIERYLAIDQLGFVVAYVDDILAGCGGVVAYPSGGFGWIGLIATDPEYTGKGIARTVTNYLLEYLRSVGCAAALDGSTGGAPLYEKMGFVDHGLTTQFEFTGSHAGPVSFSAGCSPAEATDLDDIIDFDTPRFGADRSLLLQCLWSEHPHRFVLFREPDGELCGYGVATESTLGPIVSDSEVATEAILRTLGTYEFAHAPRLNVPPESSFYDLIATMDDFTPGRALRHQRLGIQALPGRRDCLVAQCSFGEG